VLFQIFVYIVNMNNDSILIYADHVGRFYAKQYSFPPVVGRLIGYLSVCQPEQQSIGDISEALLASRSAINGAVKMLETLNLISRTRPAGGRSDLISVTLKGLENTGFNPNEYIQQAALAREGIDILKDAPKERKVMLQEVAALYDFLADRMPALLKEWYEYRDKVLKKDK
jgi:DNA-binding MarR family transcriptional regulator